MKKILGLLMINSFLLPLSVQADENLAQYYACMSCHKISGNLVGPAFNKVANKYQHISPENKAKLVTKVQKGGGGVWGPIPMPPNLMLSHKNAVILTDWVLSLGTQSPSTKIK
jgi:cytochrome c